MQLIVIIHSSRVSLRAFHRSMWIIYLTAGQRGKKTLNGQVEGKNCILQKNHLTEC